MGIWSRLHNGINALGDAGHDFGGFFTDLAAAPWNDDDSTSGNFLTVIYKTTVKRAGGLLSDLIGPTGVGGTIAGAFPEHGILGAPRQGIAGVVNPTLNALNVAYRDAIAHPAAAAITAASLADRPGGGGPLSLLHANNWKQGWELSMHESPGQAFALALQTKDILNPQEVAAAKRTDTYQTISGVSDALLQLTNPLNQALGSLGRLKATPVGIESGVLGKALQTGAAGRALANHPLVSKILIGDPRAELNRLVNSGRLEDLASRILTGGHDGGLMSPAQIRDAYFKSHANGAAISDALHYAATQGETVPALRVMLGHADELDALATRSAELAAKMDRLLAPRADMEMTFAGHGGIARDVVTDPAARLNAAVKEVTDAEWQTVRLDALQSTVRQFPTKLTFGMNEGRAGFENFMRHNSTIEDWFQNGPFGTVSRHIHPSAIMHSYHNMQASPFINFDDAASDVQLTRMLRNAKVPLPVEEEWTSKYMAAKNATERGAVFDRAQNAAVESIARDIAPVRVAAVAGVGNDVASGWIKEYSDATKRMFAPGPSDAKLAAMTPKEAKAANRAAKAAKDAAKAEREALLGRISTETGADYNQIAKIRTELQFSDAEVRAIMERASLHRKTVKETLDSTLFDGKGRGSITHLDENGNQITEHLPLWITQQTQYAPIVNMREVRKAVQPLKAWKARYGETLTAAEHVFDKFDRVWRPAVLLTPGGVVRRIGDEAIRSTIRLGLLSQFQHLEEGAKNMWWKRVGGAAPGTREASILGESFQGARGAVGDAGDLYQHLASSSKSLDAIFGQAEDGVYRQLAPSGSWTSVKPGDALYKVKVKGMTPWERAVNRQIGQDPIFRKFLGADDGPGIEVVRHGHEPSLSDAAKHEMGAYTTPVESLKGAPSPHRGVPGTRELRGKIDPKNPLEVSGVPTAAETHGLPVGAGILALRDLVGKAEFARLAKFDQAGLEKELARLSPGTDWAKTNGRVEALDTYAAKLARQRGHDAILYRSGAGAAKYDEIVALHPSIVRTAGGMTPAQVETWLTKTQEGRYLRKQISTSSEGLRPMLDDAHAQMTAYLPTEELRQAAAQGRATHAMLDASVDESLQPVVHGELLAEVTGGGPVMRHIDRFTRAMFHNLEGRPTDFLMRNPTFSDMYTREVARRAGLFKAQGGVLDDVTKTQIENRSRQFALNESKKLFDDYTDRSQIARQLRFVVPFYGAYMQQIARYAGVISSDPSWIRKLQQVWQAPAKAGLVTDSAGNTLDEHGNVTEPVKGGGFKKGDKGASGGHYITMSLPKELIDIIPGMKHGGTLKLGQSGLNMLTRGLPTFGPLVQMPVNEIVKNNPTLAESLKFVLPYGARQDTLAIVEPTTMRHFLDATDENGRLFVNTQVGIFHDDYVAWNLKHKYESPEPADIKKMWDDAKGKARAYMMMHTLSQSFVPSSYTQGSPYQKYIDAYRSRLTYDAQLTDAQRDPDKGYLNPTEWFLKTFGAEYFPLTESLSHSNNGVPPTLEAFNAQSNNPRLAKMIADNPDYGNLILGSDGAGAFNYSVYQYQLAHGERSPATPEEAQAAPSISQGWREFSKLSDKVTTALNVLGLTSTTQNGAEFIQYYKNAKLAEIAGKYPDWFEEYSKVDEISNQKKIGALDAISHSKPMMNSSRDDMRGLREYLDLRKQFVARLASSEFKTITAQGNADLKYLWDASVHMLVERNPAFGALYNRWLSRDTLAGLSPAEQAYESAVAV